MYLAAQRIRIPPDESRIASYYYQHGADRTWKYNRGIPDEDPGVLVYRGPPHPGPEGVVLSFLDLAAPDGTPEKMFQEIYQRLLAVFSSGPIGSVLHLPLSLTVGPYFGRFYVQPELVEEWQSEIHQLFERATQAHAAHKEE